MDFKNQYQLFALVLLDVIWKSFARGDVTSTPDFNEKYFVRTDEPVDKAKSYDGGINNERKAFWIVLGMTILMLLLLVGAHIFWQRHRLLELYKKKVRLWEVKVDLETEEPLQGPDNPLTV